MKRRIIIRWLFLCQMEKVEETPSALQYMSLTYSKTIRLFSQRVDSTSRSIAENTSAGENIGELVIATDLDEEDILTYTLGGIDAASFGIEAAAGQLLTKVPLDFETKNTYAVSVSVSDGKGGTDSISVTIYVTDLFRKQSACFYRG